MFVFWREVERDRTLERKHRETVETLDVSESNQRQGMRGVHQENKTLSELVNISSK